MRTIKIVADSSCDLFQLKYAEFSTSPMKVITDEREFVDDETLDTSEMVAYLANYNGKSKSSCPNTNDWLTAFGGADDIFCVAKQIYEQENAGKRVFVIDTLSAFQMPL